MDACTDCHEVGKKAPGFSEIHTGYDKVIYTADGREVFRRHLGHHRQRRLRRQQAHVRLQRR